MPQPFAFESGVEYILDGIGYRLLRVLSEGQVLVKNLMTTTETVHKANELRKMWSEGRLEFALQGRNLRGEDGQTIKTSYEFTDLGFLKENLRQETWDKYKLILPLLDLHPRERREETIRECIEAYVVKQIQLIVSGERTAPIFPQRSGKRKKKQSCLSEELDASQC